MYCDEGDVDNAHYFSEDSDDGGYPVSPVWYTPAHCIRHDRLSNLDIVTLVILWKHSGENLTWSEIERMEPSVAHRRVNLSLWAEMQPVWNDDHMDFSHNEHMEPVSQWIPAPDLDDVIPTLRHLLIQHPDSTIRHFHCDYDHCVRPVLALAGGRPPPPFRTSI